MAHVATQPRVELGDPRDLAGDRRVGLELRERGAHEPLGLPEVVPTQQVDGHVVGGREGARERIAACSDETRDGAEVEVALEEHDRVTDRVDASATGAARELRVLARG